MIALTLNTKQAQELVRSIEKALESLPYEVLAATVWVGRDKAHKLAFGRGWARDWAVVENDEWMLKYEAKCGRLEVRTQ